MTLSVSVCVPAYNEENNITNVLMSLSHQIMKDVRINQIVVVSSGSTDKTVDIVEKMSGFDSRIKLLKQGQRYGKASAINEFLKVAGNDVIVLESADTIPGKQTIEKLCLPFKDPKVGMVGAHPIPVNDRNSFMGYVSNLEWALHDRISKKRPKCGELIAFRKVFGIIPKDIAVDEAWMQYEVMASGYKIVYVPEAIVYNKGPETVTDLIKQRRRIACGHMDLEKRTEFEVPTTHPAMLIPAVLQIFPVKEPKKWPYFIGAFALEAVGRILGYYDYYKSKNNHSIWEISRSTKKLEFSHD